MARGYLYESGIRRIDRPYTGHLYWGRRGLLGGMDRSNIDAPNGPAARFSEHIARNRHRGYPGTRPGKCDVGRRHCGYAAICTP